MRYYRDSNTGQVFYINDPGSTYFDQPPQQQQQQAGGSSGIMPYISNARSMYDIYSGMNQNGGGYGGVGTVGAIIALQHALSNQTSPNRRFEGVQTDDIFSSNFRGSHFATEPWAAYGFDQLGFDVPTSGEKFDAAMENQDYGMAMRRMPAAASHYLDPTTALSYDLLQDDRFGKAGPMISKIAFPWRWAMDLFD